MNPTEEKPLTAEIFGYEVYYWFSPHSEPDSNGEPYVVDFRVFNKSAFPKEIYECEFSIKWDGCLNLHSNPDVSMHFCSHEGVRRFAAMLLKCFELAAVLMPTRRDEFLRDGHHDEPDVLAMFAKS